MSQCCNNPNCNCQSMEVSLNVNGKDVPLNPFVCQMLGGGIMGMISSLKDADDPKEIKINISCK